MEDLAWQYPAEPVERAAVRFCEAIAKWRGKPELETVSRVCVRVTAVFTLTLVQEEAGDELGYVCAAAVCDAVRAAAAVEGREEAGY